MQSQTMDQVDTKPRTPAETDQTVKPATHPSEEVLDFVRRDSQDDALRYLDEVRVPYGGE